MTRRGFTLLEMLLATVLAAVLMAGVLAALVAVSRDRVLLRGARGGNVDGAGDLLAWDVRTARAFSRGPGEDAPLVLVGNNGLDRATLAPDGRRVRVTYRTASGALWRQQEYLDDPARPAPWQTLVAGGEATLATEPAAPDGLAEIPDHVRLRVGTRTATASREVNR